MSIYYDLYENPKQEDAEEQKLLHARVAKRNIYNQRICGAGVHDASYSPCAISWSGRGYHR